MQNLKESWQNIPEKTRNIIKAIAAGTAVVALIAIIALFFLGKDKEYSTLFTGLSQEEATQLVGLLQEEGTSYRYDPGNGTIRVLSNVVDQTRANLLSQGYPKSGFTYDMYLNNTGLMTTESDKKQITLYELQDRLGAQIRLFEGVQDAKVVINEASDRKYALGDEAQMSASASVVITMKNGSALTEEKAQAVKTLISHAVRGMNFTDVAVLDAATMTEVASDSGGSTSGSATDLTSLTTLVESNIAGNVRRVLEQLYGTGNVAVSVKGTLNMERLIQESTQYTTPDRIDEEDKRGLLETEELNGEGAYGAEQAAGGVVGTDANADTPRYTNEDGTAEVDEGYNSYSASRQWLYNILKEQRQIDPGVLEDVSIGVVILTDDSESVPEETLRRLVANSAGVPLDTAGEKITIVRAPNPEPTQEIVVQPDGFAALVAALPLAVWIAILVGIVLLILLLILLLVRRRKKRKEEEAEVVEIMGGGELSAEDLAGGEVESEDEDAEGLGVPGLAEIEDEFAKNEEILNLRMQRSLRLKQNIAEFVDQNPQIVAKLIQGWLNGEEESEDGNGNRSNNRKRSK